METDPLPDEGDLTMRTLVRPDLGSCPATCIAIFSGWLISALFLLLPLPFLCRTGIHTENTAPSLGVRTSRRVFSEARFKVFIYIIH